MFFMQFDIVIVDAFVDLWVSCFDWVDKLPCNHLYGKWLFTWMPLVMSLVVTISLVVTNFVFPSGKFPT